MFKYPGVLKDALHELKKQNDLVVLFSFHFEVQFWRTVLSELISLRQGQWIDEELSDSKEFYAVVQ